MKNTFRKRRFLTETNDNKKLFFVHKPNLSHLSKLAQASFELNPSFTSPIYFSSKLFHFLRSYYVGPEAAYTCL